MTQRLDRISLAEDPRAYNAQVEANNKLVANVNRLQGRIERDKAMRKGHRESIVAYSQALSGLESHFQAVLGDPAAQPDQGGEIAAAWMEKAGERLHLFQDDFLRMAVPLSRRPGQGTIVGVSINGADPVSFILDTGASLVTVSETLARRLKLRFDRTSPIRLTMADGSEAEGFPVLLSSVAVGEAKAERIKAVVIAHPPAEGVEGLLGMTFLQHFEMSFDGSTATLVLTRLK
jgi:clan AA aspartic protease (TIGR02281 family)